MQTILLVEDNEMNRDLISRRLKRRGFEVTLAVDGAEGVEKATELKPDLVLMDMGLPIMDGYEATRLLKANADTRGIPVVGLSAHAMSGDASRALEAGCDDYDTKPIEWPRLLEKISQQLLKAQEQTTLITRKPSAAEVEAAADAARVLVVDDNAVHREMLSGRLTSLGHLAETAHDATRALEILAEQDFDAVLIDVTLPAIGDKSLLEHLRAESRYADLPVLMLSTIDSVRQAIECLSRGADDFIPQPFQVEVVEARLASALDRRRLRQQAGEISDELTAERRRTAHLLDVLLPGELVAELRTTGKIMPRRVDGAALLGCEVADFGRLAASGDAAEILSRWQRLVVSFEEIVARHGLTGVGTSGTSFVAAGGLFQPDSGAALTCLRCAFEMRQSAAGIADGWNLRFGVHQGSVLAGVFGHRRYRFDVCGGAVDDEKAVRRHQGVPGAIHVSNVVWNLHGQRLTGSPAGEVVSGSGVLASVYRVDAVGG